MKRSSLIIGAGCLIALALGLALAYPLFVTYKPVTTKNELAVNVVYVYLGASNFDPQITGLYRNSSNPQLYIINQYGGTFGAIGDYTSNATVLSYFMVLNVTNLSNQQVQLTGIHTLLGPSITTSDFFGGSVAASNPILNDYRQLSYSTSWNDIWSANASRLIYLSGIIGVHDLNKSINGTLWVYAQVNGAPYGETNVLFVGADYKQLPFQTFGQNHLYNNLVGENQTLIFYNGFDVSVGRLSQ